MANIYLNHSNDTGKTLKATIERLSDGFFREDDAETFTDALAFADKDITLTEGSAENAGTYTATLAGATWTDGLYKFRVHDTGQSNQVVGSSIFAVKNGAEVSIGEESAAFDLYTADIQFCVDEAQTQDEYNVTWLKNGIRITSGITSPTIQIIKRSDGTNLIASTAMTQIGSTGSYKYDATGASRQTAGETYVVIAGATIDSGSRTFPKNLGRDSSV